VRVQLQHSRSASHYSVSSIAGERVELQHP
jgi:hypothetical protein